MPEWFFQFPFELSFDLRAIDDAIRSFRDNFSGLFDAISMGLIRSVSTVRNLLNHLPWWLLMALVFLRGWRASGKIRRGVLYAALLSFIGFVGLWDLMNQTLAIVIVSVVLSVVIGFPLGVFIAGSDRANRIFLPVLDTMQTMPVFVYLIPAIVFFGVGIAPAVIATTIYAVVPLIRLTNLGIRQIDAEVVEAAKAFGSTKMQALIKVQIPQAMQTIKAGLNQTLMMAMAMVVTGSMVGAGGLGMEVFIGVNRIEMGRGIIAGTCVVILAILLDRLMQSSEKGGKGGQNE